MALVDVASVGELEEGIPKVVRGGRREIVLVQWDGGVFALRNICPHQSQSFAGGVVGKRIEGTGKPGQIVIRHDSPLLTCPWHRWEFELESGRCALDPGIRVRTYETIVEGDRVFVRVDVDAETRETATK
jgi:nitrite reductase/ring-hydroxylating ferredoxin subunit